MLSVYDQQTFPPVLKWQAIAFMRVEWPFVFTGPGRLITEPYPPDLAPMHFVAAEEDVLLSYASTLRLTIPHIDTSYTVLGFGNMFTFPPYRREGLGGQVLALATSSIQQSDADVAILFCDLALEAFYARSSWEAIPAATYVGAAHEQHTHDALRMMLFISEKGQAARAAFRDVPLVIEDAW